MPLKFNALLFFISLYTLIFTNLPVTCKLLTPINSMIIDRAIVSSDANPYYLDFWPIVAKAWNHIGIKPTLALIANKNVKVDETIGDVIRFEPIAGVPDGLYAQTIRLLLPIYFEQEVSIISDIDMIPLNKSYFISTTQAIPDTMFVVFRDKAYWAQAEQYPMCYNAAKGATFKEIFGVNSIEDIPAQITKWAQLNLGWSTDEIILYKYLTNWKHYKDRCVKLGQVIEKRLDRGDWRYDKQLLQEGYYIDCHSIRPYAPNKEEIDMIVQRAFLVKQESK